MVRGYTSPCRPWSPVDPRKRGRKREKPRGSLGFRRNPLGALVLGSPASRFTHRSKPPIWRPSEPFGSTGALSRITRSSRVRRPGPEAPRGDGLWCRHRFFRTDSNTSPAGANPDRGRSSPRCDRRFRSRTSERSVGVGRRHPEGRSVPSPSGAACPGPRTAATGFRPRFPGSVSRVTDRASSLGNKVNVPHRMGREFGFDWRVFARCDYFSRPGWWTTSTDIGEAPNARNPEKDPAETVTLSGLSSSGA